MVLWSGPGRVLGTKGDHRRAPFPFNIQRSDAGAAENSGERGDEGESAPGLSARPSGQSPAFLSHSNPVSSLSPEQFFFYGFIF